MGKTIKMLNALQISWLDIMHDLLHTYVQNNSINRTDPSGLFDNYLPQLPSFSERFPSSRTAAISDIATGGLETAGALTVGVAAGISYFAGPEFWPISVLGSGASIEAAWDGIGRINSGVEKLNELSSQPVINNKLPELMKCH